LAALRLTAPPERLDNADVILWARAEPEPFGVVRYSTGGSAHPIHGLAICRYSASGSIYRFSCDLDWEVIQDADYQSIEEAVAAAAQMFSPAIDWHVFHPPAPTDDSTRNA
jgi:hypothetical protein